TPQVVINGRNDLVGNNREQLLKAIDRTPPLAGPALNVSGGKVSIAGGPASGAADVWLVRYDPRVPQVAVRRGENAGKTLPHRNIVKELVNLGAWTGKAQTYALPAPTDPALKTAVLLQAHKGGPILSAAKA